MKTSCINIITFVLLGVFVLGCKAVSSESKKNQIDPPKIQADSIKLHPSEALVQIFIIEKKSDNTYSVKLEQLIKQSFGFSSYLNKGDTILISSRQMSLKESVSLNVIIKERLSLGESPVFDFRLIDR